MKVFKVSEACNGCGECIVSTGFLIEDTKGFAIPSPGEYIKDKDLPMAEKLVQQCPVGALSIVEQSSTPKRGKDGLAQLAKVLEERMKALEIPRISHKELAFKEEDYSIAHQQVNEYKSTYDSWDAAVRAGQKEFRSVYMDHIKEFVINALSQYKSKVLRQYYDLSDPKHTYYAGIGAKMATILKEVKAEACSLSESVLSFPEDLIYFHPEEAPRFQEMLNEEYSKYILMNDYINCFCEAFEKECRSDDRESRYENWIVAQEYGQREVKSLFGTTWKPTYAMEGVNKAGEAMLKRLLFRLSYPKDYGLRCLDDVYEDNLEFVMEEYRKLVNAEIARKIAAFKKAIGC